jgi:Fur family ferric uptake transcriptional regulator
MDREAQQLKDVLGSRGLKNTRERKIILKELESRKDHFKAEKLYSSLTRKGTRVSRPTIYRTLKLLEGLHLIERFDIKKNCFYYEPMSHKKDHVHLICQYCGKIVDFPCESLEFLKSEVAKEKAFKLDNISIQVFGMCRNCQKASENGALETDGGQRCRRKKN